MTEALVVADSGPLIGLARIDQLQILPALSERILVPPAVWHEVTEASPEAPGAAAVRSVEWIEIQAPEPGSVAPLRILLDAGESEAIALAQQIAALVVLDDSRARRVAERLGVRRIGTVGLLRRAKLGGFIAELRPQLDRLQNAGIHLSPRLIDAVLESVGES